MRRASTIMYERQVTVPGNQILAQFMQRDPIHEKAENSLSGSNSMLESSISESGGEEESSVNKSLMNS